MFTGPLLKGKFGFRNNLLFIQCLRLSLLYQVHKLKVTVLGGTGSWLEIAGA